MPVITVEALMKEVKIEQLLNDLENPISEVLAEIATSSDKENEESLISFKESIKKFNEQQELKFNSQN